MNSRYAIDRPNGKLLGVCAGLARSTGWDPTIIRIATVLATLFVLGPVAIVAYLVTALVAAR